MSLIFQDLHRHGRKQKPNRVTDVTRNRAFSDSEGQYNAVLKSDYPYKVLEYVTDRTDAFEHSGEIADGQSAQEEEAPPLGPQAKLSLNPVYGNYEEKELRGEQS